MNTQALELARTYRMPEAIAVAEISLATLALIEGRYTDAEHLYLKADKGMRSAGSVHAAGFLPLALATIRLNDGTLGAHLDDIRALHTALGPMVCDLLALALHAVSLDTEAREVRASSGPIRRDFFFTFLTTLRAMAVIALNDRDAAEDIYTTLLPHRNGPAGRLEACHWRCPRSPTPSANWPSSSAATTKPPPTSPKPPPSPTNGTHPPGPPKPASEPPPTEAFGLSSGSDGS